MTLKGSINGGAFLAGFKQLREQNKLKEKTEMKFKCIDCTTEFETNKMVGSLRCPECVSLLKLQGLLEEGMEEIREKDKKHKRKVLEGIEDAITGADKKHSSDKELQLLKIEKESNTVPHYDDKVGAAREFNVSSSHYNQGAICPWDYIKANNMNFFEGNVIKYITRWKFKDGVKDLLKAKDYIEELIRINQK